ncbi:MAG: extracellular solute-binding protein [Clostridia bacterium]|nr:extracellular solute-binding protein [Clostridia bacterium]
MRLFMILNVIIAVIFIVRMLIDGKISRKLQYSIWLVVPIFVLSYSLISIPVSIRLPKKVNTFVSEVVNDNQRVITNVHTNRYERYVQENVVPTINTTHNDNSIPEVPAEADKPNTNPAVIQQYNSSNASAKSNQTKQNISAKSIAFVVWLSGAVVVAFVLLLNNIRFVRKVHRTRKYYRKEALCNLKVYKLNKIDSPFLLGRSIYLSSTMNDETAEYKYAVCHECCHYKHGDNIWPFVEYVFLVVLWFDPLIWIAYKLVQQDSELAVDEHVVEIMGDSNKAEYSRTLVGFIAAISKTDNYLTASTSMNGKNKSFIKARIRGIMEGTKKSIVATLAIVITITGIVSCSMIKPVKTIVNDVEKVAADSLWFDYTKKELEIVGDPTEYSYFSIVSLYPTTDGYVALFEGCPNDKYEPFRKLLMYNQGFELTDTIEMTPDMLGVNEEASIQVSDLAVIDGKPCALVNSYYFDENTYEVENKCFFLDIDAQEISSIDYLKETAGNKGSIESFGGSSNDYVYVVVYKYEDNKSSYDIIFGKDGGLVKSIDVVQTLGVEEVWSCHLVSEEDGILYFVCNDTKYLEIDTSNLSTKVNDHYESHDVYFDYFNASIIENDGKTYVVDQDGILCDGEIAMPFSATYVNKTYVTFGARLLWASDDRYVVLSQTNYGRDYSVYTFNKAESNPNAGKTILTVGCAEMDGLMSVFIAEAISEFNQSNENYFVKPETYTYSTYRYDGDASDAQHFFMEQDASIANQLAIDMLSGEGPDIILGAYDFTQLNNENYLYDLSDIVDEIDVEVFDNVIEASKTNGKLYQMPLSFFLSGIYAPNWKVEGEVGFTFDEYANYVDKGCNGTNPMQLGRMDFFYQCMLSMSDEFFDEKGNVSFQNDAFYELAKYCRDNVPEEIVEVELHPGDVIDWATEHYTYRSLDMQDYIIKRSFAGSILGFYGIPSVDGRGPTISIFDSIAISAAASDYDGAKEFLKFFFSSDSERFWGDSLNIGIPVIVSASNKLAKREIDLHNENYDDMLTRSTEAELTQNGIFRFDYDLIDDYTSIIRSASVVGSMDKNIGIIVIEEIPAYFTGQKPIEDVAAIIENRAQTVIEERK